MKNLTPHYQYTRDFVGIAFAFGLALFMVGAAYSPAHADTAPQLDPDRETVTKSLSTYGVNFEDRSKTKALFGRLQQTTAQVCNSDGDRMLSIRLEDRQCAVEALAQAVHGLNEPHLLAMLDQAQGVAPHAFAPIKAPSR